MRTNIKGFIAKVLVLCMIVGLLPTVALAATDVSDGGTYYTVKADATSHGAVSIYYQVNDDAYVTNTLDASATYSVKADTSIKITLTADSGYTIDTAKSYYVMGDANAVYITSKDTTVPLTGNLTITAVFKSSGGGGGGGYGGGGGGSSTTVTTPSAKNGSFTVSDKNAKAGDTVKVTPKADKGYVVDQVIVNDKNGRSVPVTKNADGTYSFTMPEKAAQPVDVKVTFREEKAADIFTDVPNDAYYAEAVLWAYRNGITSGTSDTTFSPNASCTRAQMVTFLWRAAGSPKATGANPFADVAAGTYYYDAVQWAAAKGITSGTSATTFSPDATVTRDQTVTFLYRFEGSPAAVGSTPFADVDPGAYYANAVQWAASKGITSGTSATTFSPSEDCTRSQIVTFLYRDMVTERG